MSRLPKHCRFDSLTAASTQSLPYCCSVLRASCFCCRQSFYPVSRNTNSTLRRSPRYVLVVSHSLSLAQIYVRLYLNQKHSRSSSSNTMARKARLNRLSRITDRSSEQPAETEPKLVAFKISAPAPHRQFSLLAITIILNTLLWSAVVCAVIALFQIASDSTDHSNILPGVLTLVSVSSTGHMYGV